MVIKTEGRDSFEDGGKKTRADDSLMHIPVHFCQSYFEKKSKERLFRLVSGFQIPHSASRAIFSW